MHNQKLDVKYFRQIWTKSPEQNLNYEYKIERLSQKAKNIDENISHALTSTFQLTWAALSKNKKQCQSQLCSGLYTGGCMARSRTPQEQKKLHRMGLLKKRKDKNNVVVD